MSIATQKMVSNISNYSPSKIQLTIRTSIIVLNIQVFGTYPAKILTLLKFYNLESSFKKMKMLENVLIHVKERIPHHFQHPSVVNAMIHYVITLYIFIMLLDTMKLSVQVFHVHMMFTA